MKLLLISWSVLPQSGGSSVIVENLAQNFKSEELIVLGSSTWKRKSVKGRKKGIAVFRYFFTEMYFMGRGYRYFTWFRKWRFKPLIRHIKRIIQEEEITHVIGVYPNPFYCLAAARAAKELSIPFSSYFHNTYLENVAITDPNAEQWQQEIFDASDKIFVMSKGMQSFYQEKYGGKKFLPLVHTFNDFPPTDSLKGVPGVEKEKYQLVAFGNFNESNLEATKRFLAAIKGHKKYTLSIYTHVPKILLQKRGLDTSLFTHMGAVRPEEIHGELQKYDVCILTHGFTGSYGEVEYQTIFPTRTIPMLLSGKPILAHSPKGSFLNQFISENNCAQLVEEASEEAVVKGLESIVTDEAYQAELMENAQKASKLFYGPTVVDQLKSMLQ